MPWHLLIPMLWLLVNDIFNGIVDILKFTVEQQIKCSSLYSNFIYRENWDYGMYLQLVKNILISPIPLTKAMKNTSYHTLWSYPAIILAG